MRLIFCRGGFTSKFMTTSTILRAFSDGMKSPPAGAKIVYVDGAFDMFHAGHIEMLAKASALWHMPFDLSV